jgi:MerR family transcriptional regulator/heat shock protein HspR
MCAARGRSGDAKGGDAGFGNPKNRPLYMISVAAELTGMHPQTLRIYESKGLVSPQRSNGNTRLYSQADIERLELIGRLTDEGVNLAGVVRILDQRSQIEELNEEIDQLREEVKGLREQIREYRTRETITALTRYDGSADTRTFLNRMLGEGDAAGADPAGGAGEDGM